MDRKVWASPIILDMHLDGHYRVVTSAKEAAKVLSNEWPPAEGYFYRNALAQTAAALRGDVSPELCRGAFLLAARHAGIPVVNG